MEKIAGSIHVNKEN